MPARDSYAYQKTRRFFAQIADGLEALGTAELERLGAWDVKPAYRGLYFNADPEALYRINYTARMVTRVLAPLLSFDCHSARYLYKTALSVDWVGLIGARDTFAVFANVSNSAIRHSQYAALKLKDAIADQHRDRTGRRPDVDTADPDVIVNLHIHANRATVSLDTSGGSLHRRGYRLESVGAPMQETVAAAIVEQIGWDGERPLHDPMCGSGTLVSEALMRCCRVPSGYLRERFGFEKLPDFDPDLWRSLREKTDGEIRELPPGLIGASDADERAVAVARKNARCLPSGGRIRFRVSRFQDLEGFEDATLVCNPPYGVRMGERDAAARLAGELGDFLKKKCRGSTAFVYFGDRQLVKRVGLRAAWKRPLKTGGLDGRLVRYDIY